MRELLMMEPIFKEAIWGGSRLKEVYGYDIPAGTQGSAGLSAPTEAVTAGCLPAHMQDIP